MRKSWVRTLPSIAGIAIFFLGSNLEKVLGEAAAPPSISQSGTYTVTEHLDMEMVKRHQNFGYSDEEIHKYFDYPQVFEYDSTGIAAGRIKPPPAPGVHPRVFFYSEDLPELRRKLAESKPNKLQMDGIRAVLQKDLTGPKATYAALYDAAARGEERPELLDTPPACSVIYETFRCLIDNDEAGGRKAAAALTTLARMDSVELDKQFAKSDQRWATMSAAEKAKAGIVPPMRDYQESKGLTQNGLLPLGYDFLYNWMTGAQRDTVRATIAKASANMSLLCAEGLPAFPANTSNWIPMHMRLLLLACAIEGETGSDPGTYHRCVEGYKRYLNVGGFPAGDMYESMAKNFLCAENLILVANRGNNLLALKKVRAQVADYYLHAMDPWGGHFTFYDSLGGRGNSTPVFDVGVMKHLFPADPAIDFVYRNTVGEGYDMFKGQIHFGHQFYVAMPMVQAIFAEEYAPRTWDQSRAAATAGKPLTFFSNDSGNLITRTSWEPDALQLLFLARTTSGGHQYADRGHFSLHALGRYWAIYKPLRQVEEHYLPRNRSVILIDGKGPGMTMGRVVTMEDKAQATFMTADEKSAYEWQSGGNNRFPQGGVRVTATANDFRLVRSDLPWMDLPWSDLPYWFSSIKGAEMWIPYNQVQRAFRTAGLVRGTHPYVLITDDFQKDSAPHGYEWGMVLEDDLAQAKDPSDDDIVLAEKKPGNEPRFLLVRMLNAQGRESVTVETSELPNPPIKPIEINRLTITAHSIAPDFRMLLFPYRQGQQLPTTAWNDDRTRLRIEWADQKDEVSFNKGDDGRTRVGVMRNGKQIAGLR